MTDPDRKNTPSSTQPLTRTPHKNHYKLYRVIWCKNDLHGQTHADEVCFKYVSAPVETHLPTLTQFIQTRQSRCWVPVSKQKLASCTPRSIFTPYNSIDLVNRLQGPLVASPPPEGLQSSLRLCPACTQCVWCSLLVLLTIGER